MRSSLPGLWVWAARDVLRRPVEALLAGAAIASLVAVLAAGLLLAQGLSGSAERVLEGAPSLVLRRLSPGGWAPMPTRARERIEEVTGVTRVSARTWGVVRWQETSVTVVALSPGDMGTPENLLTAPEPGEAITGPALDLEPGQTVSLHGVSDRTLQIKKILPASWGLVAHDVILLHDSDARALLGLRDGDASDFAVWVFHDSEVDAIRPDLEQALPFPVHITSARESFGATKAQLEKASGLLTTLLVPALLALALLTTAMIRIQLGSRRDIGLLKALGWCSGDILRLHLFRALVIGLPALGVGWCVAYALVFLSGLGWAGSLLFGWSGVPPQLTLGPKGVMLTLLEVGGLVLAPCLAASLLPALRSSTVDAEEWLRGEES